MSYPYGPEPYPTWDELERWQEQFRTALYSERERILRDMMERERERVLSRPITINLSVDGKAMEDPEQLESVIEHAIMGATDCVDEPSSRQESEAWGLAFAHALMEVGVEDMSMDRLFQDMCNILEDRVVGKVNDEAREREKALWEEDRRRWESQRSQNEAQ